jgi:hypothetical protein
VISYLHQVLHGWPNQEVDGQGLWHLWGNRRGAYEVLVRNSEGERTL